MFLHNDDKQIQILAKKFSLAARESWQLAATLQQWFFNDLEYADAILELQKFFPALNQKQAQELLIYGGFSYYNGLEKEKQQEIDNLAKANNISQDAVFEELLLLEAEFIFPADLPPYGVNERQECLDVFQQFLKEALLSRHDDNKKILNDRLVDYLLLEDQVFKTELINALKANQQLIGDKEIIISDKPVKSTVANWLEDFLSFGLLLKGADFSKAEYFNHSKNFLNLSEADKKLLAKFLDLCLRLFNFPKSFENLETDDWYLVPYFAGYPPKEEPEKTPAAEEDEEEETDPVTEADLAKCKKLSESYRQLIKELIDQAKFNEEQNGSNQPQLILEKLNSNLALKDASKALADLKKLIEARSLKSLLTSSYFAGPFSEYVEARLGPVAKNLASQASPESLSLFLKFIFIIKLRLPAEKAAALAIYLGNQLARQGEKQYLRMAYGDSQTGTFKWREVMVKDEQLAFK